VAEDKVVARTRRKFSSAKENRKGRRITDPGCQASVSLPSGFRKAGGVQYDA